MLLSELGEFGLIQRLKKRIKLDRTVVKGTGDDCAVLKRDKYRYQLIPCDMLVEGVDFTLKDKPGLIGRKAVFVSVSDIAACAGNPRHCVVSLAVPGKTKVSFIDELFKGMLDAAKTFSINIVGGDLSRSEKIIIDVSMLGEVKKSELVTRSGAKAGDIIFTTGALGGSIYGKHLKFTPRLKEARELVKRYKINSMIDISDGLAQDLGHIMDESGVGAIVYEDLIPLSADARDILDALYSGEDFELLFTASRAQAHRIMAGGLKGISAIGEIVDKKLGLRLVDKKLRERAIKPKGFRHF